MHLLDRYTYTNRLRRVDPAHKAALASGVVLLCLTLDRPSVGLLAVLWMLALAVLVAGLPLGAVLRVLLIQSGFLVMSMPGIVLSVSLQLPDSAWRWQVGLVWISSSPSALAAALHLSTRAMGSTAALTFLAMTTPLTDLIALLQRLRLPPLLIDLCTLIYRFIFVLLECIDRIATAQASRLGYRTFGSSMRSAGLLGSRLFVETYQRSQRLHTALLSRGYDTELRVLPIVYQPHTRFIWLSLGLLASLLAVGCWPL